MARDKRPERRVRNPRPSTFGPRPPFVAAAARLRLRASAGDDKQDVPGSGGDSIPLGAAAGAVPVELHHLLRQSALVCAPAVHACAHGGLGRHLLGAVQGTGGFHSTAIEHLFRGAFRLLHGLSWRTLPAQARPAPSDRILLDDCRRRRAGRTVGGGHRATDFHRLLRIAMGAFGLRPAVADRLRARLEPGPFSPVALPGLRRAVGEPGRAGHCPGVAGPRAGQRNGLPFAQFLRRAHGVRAPQERSPVAPLSDDARANDARAAIC